MGIPLLAGRLFANRDGPDSSKVAIVNEALARREFGEPVAALGRRLVVVTGGGQEQVEIVGVTGNIRLRRLDRPPEAEIYRPLAQTFMFPMAFVVRTDRDPAERAAAVRQAATGIDAGVPVADLQPLTSLLAGTLERPRLLTMLLTVFASTGLLLGIIGVYGVVAYRVRQRERESGIRLALGAEPGRIARTVARQGTVYALVGLAMGVPAAFALGQLMQSVVFGVTTHDPLTFASVPLTVVASVLACVWPARRASRADPAMSMRQE